MNDVSIASERETLRIDYVPRPGLLRITIVNFLLGIVTLTIYRFWGKTQVRMHIWSCVHINGEPLEYTGRGIELFKGAMIVLLAFVLPAIILISALTLVLGPEHPSVFGVQSLLFFIVWVLWGAALYRARRYQLSRTLWRGIRGTLEGSTAKYSLLYFGSFLATGMTLGWATPVLNLSLQEMMIGNMKFGDMPFRFKGRAGPLYPTYALCWFLTLLAVIGVFILIAVMIGLSGLAFDSMVNFEFDDMLVFIALAFGAVLLYLLVYPLIWSNYTAKELAVFASYTTFDQARFSVRATGWSIFRLLLGNALLWLLTLGIAAPFIQQRRVRYLCERMTVEGGIDIDRILQSKAPLGTSGEGLADAFDVGGI